LIRYHNELSFTAQKEDIYNPKVVAKFTALFPTKLELDLIYILTYADTNGVGNNIYNEFTASLFHTLYKNAIQLLTSIRNTHLACSTAKGRVSTSQRF